MGRIGLFPAAAASLAISLQVSAGWAEAPPHPLAIHPGQHVASLILSPSEYASWRDSDDFNNETKRLALIRELYQSFRDDFDFIFLVLDEAEIPAGFPYYGELIPVANAITGLGSGTRVFDKTRDYGSGGRLKSVMSLVEFGGLALGPSLHELMHTWGNYAIQAGGYEPDGMGGGTPYADYRPHWGLTGGNTPGQLGGFKQSTLKENVGGNPKRYQADAFGLYANGGNSKPYSQMELYLAGFLPVGQVEPFDVFRDVTAYDYASNTWEAGTRIRYDSARIVAELGARSPGYAASQKDFRLLIVVLSDKPLPDSAWNAIDRDAERFGRPGDDGTAECNFWEATGGRARMATDRIASSLINPVRIGPKVPGRPFSGWPGSGFDALGRSLGLSPAPAFPGAVVFGGRSIRE